MWCVLLKCLVRNGSFDHAILRYREMLRSNVKPSAYAFPSMLKASTGYGDLRFGEIVHGSVISLGFQNDDVIQTSLLTMYGECGCVDHARKMFDETTVRDVVLWSSMILIYVQNGWTNEGLSLFREMMREDVELDWVTLLSAAEACGDLSAWQLARSVHGFALRREFKGDDGFLENSFMVMYGKCGDLVSAEKLFLSMENKGTSSWTSIISCYAHNSYHSKKALLVFIEMKDWNVEPNSLTMLSLVTCLARLGLLKEGKASHCYVIKKAIDPDSTLLGPALLDLYAQCGNPAYCKRIFSHMEKPNIILWNLFISAHTHYGLLQEAALLFVKMQMQGVCPDSYTLSSLLSACGNTVSILLGCQIHSHVVKSGNFDVFVHTSLMDMYSRCGFLESACMLFNQCSGKNVVTWNSMLSGLCRNGAFLKSINLFDQMYYNGLEMDEVTFLTAVQACSELRHLEKGKWVHHKVITCGINKDIYINTALTDLYAKCGEIKMAKRVFDGMLEKTLVSWSAIIDGHGAHGYIEDVIALFNQMVKSGIKPNDVAFLNVLSACSHAGYVEQSKQFFSTMVRNYGIVPKLEHFSCMVDLLSRAGDLAEAYKIIKSMPSPVPISLWGSLINGCRIHQRMDMIEDMEELVELSTTDTGYHTLLSNMHAESNNWDKSFRLRSVMKRAGLKKIPGSSSIKSSDFLSACVRLQ